jgi:hypothetical protein
MSREHKCECPEYPKCDTHRAYEWGGGEPDKCEPHGHNGIESIEEVRVRADILRVLRPFDPLAQARIIAGALAETEQRGEER